ncbi:T-cell surface glycoprotein CD8 beta chain-like [Spea bombifrons]|uniref:T-cell surface glycoprotein CD8 beta chain-like n=1 Tax=Spea bombifrons TaxID=233779 RepID=UPI0023494A77|nr:T-cell surface glycoprotein CD8 beta chain-like [Spea bombifrons]
MKHLRDIILHSCFLLLSLRVPEISSFTFLNQSTSIVALVNSHVEISCSMKNHAIDQLGVFWYRETNKTANMEFIVFATVLNKHTYNHDFVQERFSVARDYFHRVFTLKIKQVQLSDSGVYYCMVQKAAQIFFGSGTTLQIVSVLPTVTPTQGTTSKRLNERQGKSRVPKSNEQGIKCSPVIWGSLAGGALLLTVFLVACILHTYRVYRRSRLFFRKHSPN